MIELVRHCSGYLREDGFWSVAASFDGRSWRDFRLLERLDKTGVPTEYLVRGRPVDLHCHGVGTYDFSTMTPDDLPKVEALLARRGVRCIATLYVSRERVDRIDELLKAFGERQRAGAANYLVGFALEGPMLGRSGGIPKSGAWRPTRAEWERIASWAELGLRYMVMSPDSMDFDVLKTAERRAEPGVRWVVELMTRAGVKPALGHFERSDPEASARCIEIVLGYIESIRGGADCDAVLTDHLFNDMPLRFKHAWRSAEEKARRTNEVERIEWTWDNLAQRVGPVPYAIMKAARDGRLTACMNFDGEHVDHEYCRRAVALLGTESLMAITDHTEVRRLADEHLTLRKGSALLWQADGLVAAGGQEIPRQFRNMSDIGISESEAWRMFAWTPSRFFGLSDQRPDCEAPSAASLVIGGGHWLPVGTEHAAP